MGTTFARTGNLFGLRDVYKTTQSKKLNKKNYLNYRNDCLNLIEEFNIIYFPFIDGLLHVRPPP